METAWVKITDYESIHYPGASARFLSPRPAGLHVPQTVAPRHYYSTTPLRGMDIQRNCLVRVYASLSSILPVGFHSYFYVSGDA